MLDEHGFDSIEAADEISALQFVSPDGIDLIISDFGPPRLEGQLFLDIIKRGAFGQAPPPLIFCSALLQSEGWMRKLADEGIPLLVRPFTPHAFELALAAAFAAD
jgi:DNA-binding response OmpR family regulator